MNYNDLSKEELIKEIEKRNNVFEEFLLASSDGYWDWYIQDDYEYMSPRFWEIIGVDHKTKKHKPSEWQDLIHPDDLEVALDNFKKHCESKGEHPYSQEVRYKHSNGSWVTVICKGRVVEWSDSGEPIRMIGTHTDITELKENEFKYKTVLNTMSDAVFVFDPDTFKIIDANDATSKIYGYDRDELIGMSCLEFSAEVDESKSKAKLARANGKVDIPLRHHKNKNGEDLFVDLSAYKITINGKELMFAVVDNVTSRVKFIEELKEQEENLRLSTELAGVAVWKYDFTTNTMIRSKNHDKLYGLDWQETWDINTFLNATHQDDREVSNKKIIEAVSPGGEDFYQFEFRVVFPDNSIHWLLVKGLVVERNEKGEGVTVRGCLLDITELKEKEIEKERLFGQIERYSEDLKRLLYISSHDLKTPLVNISGFTQELYLEFQDMAEALVDEKDVNLIRERLKTYRCKTIPKQVELIDESIKSMGVFIEGLLNLSRLGGIKIVNRQVDVNKLLSEVSAEYKQLDMPQPYEIVVDEMAEMKSDRFLMQTIFRNIISNAVKNFQKDRAGVLNISSIEDDRYYIILFKDNGIGIPENKKWKIFDFFYRLEGENRAEGTGIGLSLVKWACMRLGGKVSCESKENEGSTFKVYIPK